MRRRVCLRSVRPHPSRFSLAARADVYPVRAQSALLAKHAIEQDKKDECVILYCWFAFNSFDYRSFDIALNNLREKNPGRLEVRVLTLLGWLARNDVHSVAASPSELWAGLAHSPLLKLCKADFLLKVGDLGAAEEILQGFDECICPEMAMLRPLCCQRKVVSKLRLIYCFRMCIVVPSMFAIIANSSIT